MPTPQVQPPLQQYFQVNWMDATTIVNKTFATIAEVTAFNDALTMYQERSKITKIQNIFVQVIQDLSSFQPTPPTPPSPVVTPATPTGGTLEKVTTLLLQALPFIEKDGPQLAADIRTFLEAIKVAV